MSIDPVTTDADSGDAFNRYSYANNNPFRYIDPDGRDVVPVPVIIIPGPLPIILPLPVIGKKQDPFASPVLSSKSEGNIVRTTLLMTVQAICTLTPSLCGGGVKFSKPAKRPEGTMDAIRGARDWGKKNGVSPDRAVDKFHEIKGGDRGPATGPKDDCSVNPETGEVFDSQGEHIGDLKK